MTPIKQDLFDAKKRIGQQDGKIILLSSQLEKKRALLEEFQEKVRILTQTVREKESLIENLNHNAGKSQDGGVSRFSSSTDYELQALLRHIDRSNDFRYVISGKEDNKYLLRSPVMLKSIRSRSNTEKYTVMVDRDIQTLTISPSSIKHKSRTTKPACSSISNDAHSLKKTLFASDHCEDKENQRRNTNCTFTSDIKGLAQNAIFKKVIGSSSPGSSKRAERKKGKKVDLVVIENPLEDTFVAEAELTCYPLDDPTLTIPSSSPYLTKYSTQSSHAAQSSRAKDPVYVDK
ncbi:hypothetical protein EON65_56720, partial [archaeon]